MIRNTILAAAIAAALGAGSALAQSSPILSGGGDDMTITYDAGAGPGGNILGSAEVRVSGGGDDRTATHANPVTAPSGLVGVLVGGGDNAVIVYRPGAAPALAMTGGPRG